MALINLLYKSLNTYPMDIQRAIIGFQKEFKSYEDLKELDSFLPFLVEPDSAFNRLSQSQRLSVINKLELIQYQDNEIIFYKGDPSNCLYIILSGSLQMFSYSPNGFRVLEKIIYKGVIGERGILKNKHRSLSAHSIGQTYLLRLDTVTFKKYLLSEFAANNLEKRKIVEKYIPYISQFSDTQKEKISYVLEIRRYYKGNTLIRIGEVLEYFMIILEGECVMLKENAMSKKVVAILDNGAIVGEDSAFFDRGSLYSVNVTSDKIKVAVIKNSDMRLIFPSAVINLIRKLIIQRNTARNKLANYMNPCLLQKKSGFTFRNLGYSSRIISPVLSPETTYLKEKKLLKVFSFSSILKN